jgi:hypothetical protein
LSRFCEKLDLAYLHEILQKTGRVRADLNSERIEASVAMGPDAISGRLRELENIFYLAQTKDENLTKYRSNLSKHLRYMNTDINPPIIAHLSSVSSPDVDNGSFQSFGDIDSPYCICP